MLVKLQCTNILFLTYGLDVGILYKSAQEVFNNTAPSRLLGILMTCILINTSAASILYYLDIKRSCAIDSFTITMTLPQTKNNVQRSRYL